MFSIESYIKYPTRTINNFEDIQKNPSYFFINIDDTTNLALIKNSIDLDYIEGVITLKHNDQFIFNFAMWDIVDQLWIYLIRMIEDVLTTGQAETYFPDQPIKLEMQKISKEYVQFYVTTQKRLSFTFNFEEFANALLISGKQFFISITKAFDLPDDSYQEELQKIDTLIKKISKYR